MAKVSAAVYYPPDGTGRDTYIILGNGGTCHEYKQGGAYIDFQKNDFLRKTSFTPRMDKL
jgi:hypothetical protein